MSNPSTTLGERITRARVKKGWSQSELARAVGVQPAIINLLESGRNKASRHLVGIASALGVTGQWLYTGKGPMAAPEISQAAARAMLAALKIALRAPSVNQIDQESGETFADIIRAAIAKAED